MNRHRNRAFAVETLLLTLFFLLELALLVQLFGAAQAMGRQARQETDAALLLQNASAQLHAGSDPWAQAMAAAPAPDTTTMKSSAFLPVISSALMRPAPEMMAVPCWSSWNTGMFISFLSTSSM